MKKSWLIIGLVLLLLIIGSGAYYLGIQKNESNVSPKPQLITQPFPGPITNGVWTIKYIPKIQGDVLSFKDIHLVNNATSEDRLVGQSYAMTPNKQAVFSKDLSNVIFLGVGNIVFYSIPQNKVIKIVTLGDIKNALPSLSIPRNAVLNSLVLSPEGDKIAMSYGYTYELDSTSDIIIVDISTYKIFTVDAKGIVKSWIDNNTLQYVITRSTNGKIDIVTREISIEVQ